MKNKPAGGRPAKTGSRNKAADNRSTGGQRPYRPGKPGKTFDSLDRFHHAYGSKKTDGPAGRKEERDADAPGKRKQYSEDRPERSAKTGYRKDDRPRKTEGGSGWDAKPGYRKDDRPRKTGDRPGRSAKPGYRKEDRDQHTEGRAGRSAKPGYRKEDGDRKPASRTYEGKPGPARKRREFPDTDNHTERSSERSPRGKKPFAREDGYSPRGTGKAGKPYAGKTSDKRERYSREDPDAFRKSGPGTYREDRATGRKKRDDDFEEQAPKAGVAESAMPLNKYIAHSGVCGRREAAALVKQGKARVNGELILEPGHKIQPGDTVSLSGKKLIPQKGLVYILLNKPKGYITTTDDPRGRKTVMELVANAGTERIFPIGRLDRNTTGLLLITNDGILAQKLSHPSHQVKKIYQVTLDKALTKADFEKILKGVELEDGVAPVDALSYLSEKNELGIEIHSGRNRIVRRIFESLGYQVDKLDRVMYAGLTKKNVPRGKWRMLSEKEIILLRHFKN